MVYGDQSELAKLAKDLPDEKYLLKTQSLDVTEKELLNKIAADRETLLLKQIDEAEEKATKYRQKSREKRKKLKMKLQAAVEDAEQLKSKLAGDSTFAFEGIRRRQ